MANFSPNSDIFLSPCYLLVEIQLKFYGSMLTKHINMENEFVNDGLKVQKLLCL